MFNSIFSERPFLATTLVFGALAALNSFLFFVFIMGIGVYPFSSVHLLEIVIIAFFIGAGVWYYRFLLAEQEFIFFQGAGIALAISVVSVVLYSTLMYFAMSSWFPQVFDLHIATQEAAVFADRANIKEYELILKNLANTKPIHIAIDEFIKKGFILTVPVIALGVFFRRTDVVALDTREETEKKKK